MRYSAPVLVLAWVAWSAPGFGQDGPALTCMVKVADQPTLRAEGLSELVGDITINCQSGNISNPPATQVNVIVSLRTPVTSRILANGGSEAFLQIDNGQPVSVCPNLTQGCSATSKASTFQGVVNGNSVVFNGIPVLVPGGTGTLVLRITDIRANVTGISGPAVANISTSNPSLMTILNNPVVVGRAQFSLSTFAGIGAFTQCNLPPDLAPGTVLKYTESFSTAFKTRLGESGSQLTIGSQVAGLADSGTRLKAEFNNVQSGIKIFVPLSDTSGSTRLVSGESAAEGSFVSGTVTLPGGVPGAEIQLANGSGTAVWEVTKADPNKIETLTFPTYVSITGTPANGAATVGLNYAPTDSPTFIPRYKEQPLNLTALTVNPCTARGVTIRPSTVTGGENATITVHLATGDLGSKPTLQILTQTVPVTPFDSQNGSAEFKVPIGTTVPLVLANNGATESGTLPIVQYNPGLGANPTNPVAVVFAPSDGHTNIQAVTICRTSLLYPFLTNQVGFDTGLEIAGTSTDPFGAQPQNGPCTLSFYDSTSNPPAQPAGAISLNGLNDYLTRSIQLPARIPTRIDFNSVRHDAEPVLEGIPGAMGDNTLTGNEYYRAPGLRIPGGKLLLNFTPSHNSSDAYTGPLGVGWTHTYNTFLILNGGNVVVKAGDGQEIPFMSAGGAFKPGIPGVFDVLHKDASGSYTLNRRNHVQFTFSSTGQLTSITDEDGNSQTLTYSSGNLTSVMDSSGRSFELSYDSSNRIVTVSDSLMRTLHYVYDAFGRLISYTDAAGGVTKYSYDVNNQMVQIVDARANKADTIAYDAKGRVVSTADAHGSVTTFAYDTPSAGSTTVTDPLGRVTVYAYDAMGRLVSIKDPLGGISSVAYDANNMILSTTDPLGHVRKFTYDANSNLTQFTDPLGNTSKFTYDSNNNLLSASDPLAHKRTFAYDSHNHRTRIQDAGGGVTTVSYDSFGHVASIQDPRNSVTEYEYDSDGNRIQRKDSLGGVTQYTYDVGGRLTGVTDPVKNHSAFVYDGLDRLAKFTDPAGQITLVKYDANGNLISVTDPRKITRQFVYDSLNRRTSVIEAAGTSEQRTTSFVYDADGNLTSVKDPNGNVTHYAYDALNRIVSKTDPLGNMAAITYDGTGNVTAVTDAKGDTNKFGYDALSRLIKEMTFSGGLISHAYDKAGNETSMTDARGVNSYRYDPVNRLTSAHTPDGNTLTYTYGVDGRLISIALPDGSKQQYTYDALDRITAAKDSAGNTTQFTYDAAGRLTREAFPNHNTVSYAYDSLSRVTSVVETNGSAVVSSHKYQYDADGNRTMDASSAGTTAYAYDHLNRLISVTQNGQVTKYTYDAGGNRTSVTTSSGVTKATYDKANRMITFGSATLSYDNNGNLINDGTHMYMYDSYNRLMDVAGYNTSYSYDGHGFRIGQKTPAGTYQYVTNLLNGRALLENSPDGDFVNFYAAALLISEKSSSTQLYYQFDPIGDVVNVTDNTGKAAQSYAYDAFGAETSMDALAAKNKYRALGGYTDPVTGLIYFPDGDYYSPVWGRTFSGNAVSGYPNPYVFQGDNPVQ